MVLVEKTCDSTLVHYHTTTGENPIPELATSSRPPLTLSNQNYLSLFDPLNSTLTLSINSDTLVSRRVLVLNRRTLNNMVLTAKDGVHLLEANLLSLWDAEPNEDSKQHIDSGEHVEGVEALVLQEDGEELLDDGVDDVLALGAHANGLRTDVHGEDLSSEDPDGRAPGGFV